MSNQTSNANKTEKPTPRRKREARREGNLPKSQEVPVAASMLVTLIALRAFAPFSVRTIVDQTRTLFGMAGAGIGKEVLADSAARMFIVGAAPFLGVAMVLGVSAGVAQVGFVLAPKAAKPKLSNLSPKKGAQKFKPSVASWDLARVALKLGLLIAVTWQPLAQGVQGLVGVRTLDRGLAETASLVWTLLTRAALLALVIAAADYTVAKVRNTRQLKMTKQEVKREMKDQEGDPIVKAMRRRRAHEMSRNRIINVATADVVVTNPTHFAVALSYRPPEPAPRVVAKGTDRAAKRIRRMASRHGVPIIEQRPLARMLYRQVKVGKFVPAALYEAAAVVLAEAYRRRRRRAA